VTDRYKISNSVEGQYQPGSDDSVLLNKLGITEAEEMDEVELVLLDQLYDVVFETVKIDQPISIGDIFEWHRKWFANVYEWAGQERSVNMAKGDFPFATAQQIPFLLKELNKIYLSKYTPCHLMDDEALIEAIAVVHVEFILIHPFREGNGRIARLLANVMAVQAGKLELDFSSWDSDKEKYFMAIQAGMDCNYEPLKQLVSQALLDALQDGLS
jgi:cell filamentation protein